MQQKIGNIILLFTSGIYPHTSTKSRYRIIRNFISLQYEEVNKWVHWTFTIHLPTLNIASDLISNNAVKHNPHHHHKSLHSSLLQHQSNKICNKIDQATQLKWVELMDKLQEVMRLMDQHGRISTPTNNIIVRLDRCNFNENTGV